MKQKKGFTLIELLVVIAIIAILSAIGLVALNGAREKARDAQRQSDLGQIRTALSLWYDDNSFVYPPQHAALALADDAIDTHADCVREDPANPGTLFDAAHDAAAPGAFTEGADPVGAPNNIFTTGGEVVPAYLGGQLPPPGGDSSAAQDYYCYDANDGAGNNSSYVIYTRLEAGDGPWYWVTSDGDSGNTAYVGEDDHTTCTGAMDCAF